MEGADKTVLLPTQARSDDSAEMNSPKMTVGAILIARLQLFVNSFVPWRQRLIFAALIVGLLCGCVAVLYEKVMDYVLEKVWKEGGDLYGEYVTVVPKWTFIPLICITFGGLTGVLIRLLGEPMANLPGVVLAAHRDGLLGHEEAPAMAAISITSIVAAGSLGPEAPLVSIGGGLASLVALFIDLSEAETLFVTMCGMGAGLAAFFGEPVGGESLPSEAHRVRPCHAPTPCASARTAAYGRWCRWGLAFWLTARRTLPRRCPIRMRGAPSLRPRILRGSRTHRHLRTCV